MSDFQSRNYEAIALILGDSFSQNEIETRLISNFQFDNSNFNQERFLKRIAHYRAKHDLNKQQEVDQ